LCPAGGALPGFTSLAFFQVLKSTRIEPLSAAQVSLTCDILADWPEGAVVLRAHGNPCGVVIRQAHLVSRA